MPFTVLDKLLGAIKLASTGELKTLLDFANKYRVAEADVYITGPEGKDMLRALQIKVLGNEFKSKLDANIRGKFATVTDSLLSNEWTFEQLKKIITAAKSDSILNCYKRDRAIVSVLQLLSEYVIAPDLGEEIL